MHHALQIQEILSRIFEYCCPLDQFKYPTTSSVRIPSRKVNSDLAALARTCRTFKEPALDVLWRVLFDMSPLAQCLPEASSVESKHSFSRPLTQTEWHILQGYIRRIRSIQNFNDGFDWESVATFLNPLTTEPLFPNLRALGCRYAKEIIPLLQLPLPSLTYLDIVFETQHSCQNFLHSFPKVSPNIRTLFVDVNELENMPSKIEPNYMYCWQDLHSMSCPHTTFDVDVLVHLSRMPALTRLDFTANVTLSAFDPPLIFSNLRSLTIYSKTLDIVSHLLSRTGMPALTDFHCGVDECPSKLELSSFFACVRTSNTGHTMESLGLEQIVHDVTYLLRSQAFPIGFEDLQPFMAFKNFRHMKLTTDCNVSLTDDEVLALASAWPKMECFYINPNPGWNTTSGITPGGLLQLLRICPSLDEIGLRLDTRGYTTVPPSQFSAILELTPSDLEIHVADSLIEAECVLAITTFFCNVGARAASLTLDAWYKIREMPFLNVLVSMQRWKAIRIWVDKALDQYCDSEDAA